MRPRRRAEEEEEDDDTPRGANDDDDESKSKSFLEESKHSENALATAFQYSSADSGNALCAWPPVVLEKSSRFSLFDWRAGRRRKDLVCHIFC